MISNLVTTRLLSNLIRFSRYSSSLAGYNKKPLFLGCRTIRNLNELSVRSVAVLPEQKEEIRWNLFDQLEKDVHQLSFDAKLRRVYKEDIKNVFKNLKQLGEIKSHQIILLLKCCTKVSFMCSEKERIQMAEEFWETAKNLGIKFDVNHFNELLNVYVANNHKFSCEDYLNKMESAGVKPDILTFRYLLRASCQHGDVNGAKNLLDKMKSMGIPIDTLDFNSLILAYSKIGDFEKVSEILSIMDKKGVKPTSKSYLYLLCGYIEHGNLVEFENLFNKLYIDKNVNLSNWDLLEIVYSLAVKNHEGYIDMVMERMTGTVDKDHQISSCVQRLLHEKKDSTALKLMDSIEISGRSFTYALSVAKNVLDHYVWYRSPKEVLEICQKLEEKELARAAVGYCLKRVFLYRDIEYFKAFLSQMKSNGLPVRGHYYWPMIVQEAKKGNEALISFLKETPLQVRQSPDSVYNFILPNYVTSENWQEDFEKLKNLGIPHFFTSRHFLNQLLEKQKLDDAEKLVLSYPLDVSRVRQIFNYLMTILQNKEEAVEQVINVVYYVYHDVHLFEDTFKNIKDFVYFDEVIYSLLRKIEKKEVVMRVLQAMLEKKMGLSSEACSEITNTFPGEDVENITAKLSDPNLKVEFNKSLLNVKLAAVQESSEHASSLPGCVEHMLALGENGKFRRALEFGKNFLQRNKEKIPQGDIDESEDAYKRFLIKLTNSDENENSIKDFIDLGIQMGIFKKDDKHNDYFLLRKALQSNYTSRAFEIFKDILLTTGYPVLCEGLLTRCIANGETERVQQITKILTNTLDRNSAFTYLVYALSELGEIEKAKKVLGTSDFVFQRALVLKNLSRASSSELVKNLTEVLKDVNNFDKTELYKILVKNYAMKNEIDEIEKFWSEIRDEKISDPQFLEAMSVFEQDKNSDRLSKSINLRIPVSRLIKKSFLRKPNKKAALEEQYINAMSGTETPGFVSNLAVNFASLGDINKTCALLENYSIGKSVQKIATAFLNSGNTKKYFQFLDFFASKGDFISLNDCFKVEGLVGVLKNNDELYKKYKSLLLQCADETDFANPIVTCFVISAKIPEKLADAEEIIKKYNNRIKDVPFTNIKNMVEMSECAENFYENVLSSETLKNVFSEHLGDFYNNIVVLKYERNDKTEALKYLKMAEVDKVKLDGDIVALLKGKSNRPKNEDLEETLNVSGNVN